MIMKYYLSTCSGILLLLYGVLMTQEKNNALKTYKSKRSFTKTPEPTGRSKKNSKELIFVVQKHDASHLHYDFRLEVDGVLISWAVPKGLSTNPEEKHLAVMTEPHPLDYATFEGVIPEGNYGAGTVMVWDIGTYKNHKIQSLKQGLKEGKIEVELFGKKLIGNYALIRTHLHNDKRNWLIFKTKEERKVPGIKTKQRSALTDRTLDQIAQDGKGKKPHGKK